MTKTDSSPFSIVIGIDFHDTGARAFHQAARLARAIPDSRLHVVHVFEHELDAAHRTQVMAQLRPYVGEEVTAAGGLALGTLAIHLRAGEPVHQLIQLASEVAANLLVVGAGVAPSPEGWLLGPVARGLLLSGTCPVLVAGPGRAEAVLR